MEHYLKTDEWRIIESGFHSEFAECSEAIFSIGNGRMGQRANFEEGYSGKSLQGSYVAGVYYPDKTRVGWWKNGYPEYFAKVLNSVNWIGLHIEIEGERLDLNAAEVLQFERELDMKRGVLSRHFQLRFPSGKEIQVSAVRFVSMRRDEIGAIRYGMKALNFTGKARIVPFLDFDVVNQDSNYDEKFWEEVERRTGSQKAAVVARTRKLNFQVASAMSYEWWAGDKIQTLYPETIERDKYVANSFEVTLEQGQENCLYKYASVCSSMNHPPSALLDTADERASEARRVGFDTLLQEHTDHWAAKWEMSDIRIEGDVSAQQGIRFNIFQLHQTYTGEDERLNIGPKGFTGEKYGGSTYWDTEAYCLPFYLSTAPQKVAKNLLVYRYDQLGRAIENAGKLGFEKGAALYPMVTMNGEECHNEWEITFEEIHRNGAIAFAIYDYIRHTLDASYLFEGGLEVLTGIARFWFQRFHYSQRKKAFVMHGVTGPNEYENNINNNWYTNYIAAWCMRYAADCFDRCRQEDAKRTEALSSRLNWSSEEGLQWRERADQVYLPFDAEHGVFEQHDGFMDKELIPVVRLDPDQRPINQHWSWDRILRSCFIKQADVLQGVYLFSEEFDRETHERNFDFYEPFTVHESSLSPCVHAILAARLGKMDKAYELYLRTARLDLDDYNKEVAEGLHITSMAGTWMSVVQGFGGMHWVGSDLHLDPALPDQWTALEFHLRFRGALLRVQVEPTRTEVLHLSGEAVELKLYGTKLKLSAGSIEQIERP